MAKVVDVPGDDVRLFYPGDKLTKKLDDVFASAAVFILI